MHRTYDLTDELAYRVWRDAKLAHYPQRVDELIVEVADPRQLTTTDHAAILDRCRRTLKQLPAARSGRVLQARRQCCLTRY